MIAKDVFVEVFARTDAENESPRQHRGDRRRRLRDDRRMNANGRTGDGSADLYSLRHL
jgi:hypothetical protein